MGLARSEEDHAIVGHVEPHRSKITLVALVAITGGAFFNPDLELPR